MRLSNLACCCFFTGFAVGFSAIGEYQTAWAYWLVAVFVTLLEQTSQQRDECMKLAREASQGWADAVATIKLLMK